MAFFMQQTINHIIHKNPIGVFDSGIGGTSIWKEIHELLPNESSIYLADSKNAPYGVHSTEKIIELCEKNTELLLNLNCKLIVVACNTATTNAISHLRAKYDLPFIGIEPAIKPASLNSKTKTIGILATKGTLSSSLFHKTSKGLSSEIKIIEQEGTGIVELIENGELLSSEMKELLIKYIEPMISQNIDHLVLGCSHYPYLIPMLKKILPNNILIIDSGRAVAEQTMKILHDNSLTNLSGLKPNNQFYTNGKRMTLESILKNNFTVEYKDF